MGYIVRYLKLICPTLGKVRIAHMLARAGLHLSASTVRRMLARQPTKEEVAVEMPVVAQRRGLKAKCPNHIWHVDLTVIPTGAGLWVPWLPFARPQSWPFCWSAVVVLGQMSRMVLGIAVFKRRPASVEVCSFLDSVVRVKGASRHVITDKGKEFDCKTFKALCRRHSVRRRFGAVGQHGSIAVVERFIRSMKSECMRGVTVPFRLDAMRSEVGYYASWYNQHRPHSALDGRTLLEVFEGSRAANEKARFEPRPRWPRSARSNVPIKGKPCVSLTLVLSHFEKPSAVTQNRPVMVT